MINLAVVPVTPYQQNCAIIWDEETKRGVVVDPGGDLGRVLSAIRQTGAKVDKIILTHGHLDHAGGAAQLAEELKVPVEGPHRADAPLLDRLPEQGRAMGMTEVRKVTPDRWLAEGDKVSIGDLEFDVYHCPGHSPGSVVLVNADIRFAIVGDVLFNGSVGRTDLPGGDHEGLIKAIKTKLLPLGDDISFLCGHGPASTFGDERRNNPFLQGAAA
jgi:hydroxyacylglutathione hydrolase